MERWYHQDRLLEYQYRIAEFMQQPVSQTFRWLRVIGDTVFAVGALALVIFVIGLIGSFG
ncbi:MAG: hypothetical protein BGO55_25610 [Sphingobacteriales bacterium 50-39]|nr:MAG: hypothetical protein BGO55_25610 [Sphingobacteriales bacterium 50-39]